MADTTAKEYLDYLDKEMSIMGILSTFCVAAVALVVNAFGAMDLAKDTLFRKIWMANASYVLVGSGWLLLAALLFYLQRSHLAYFYGGISLSIDHPSAGAPSTAAWLGEADSWIFWLRYRFAFICLMLAFSSYGAAFAGIRWVPNGLPAWPLWVAPAVIGLEQIPHDWVLWRFRYELRPFVSAYELWRSRKHQKTNT